jgi:hypothetical protein
MGVIRGVPVHPTQEVHFVMQYYAGIGSRETPDFILDHMSSIAQVLGDRGWTLRSGGADGADSAFEQGARASSTEPHIFLPWRGFNDRTESYRSEPETWTLPIAAEHHPAWDKLNRGGRQLHCRNVHQVLGLRDEPHSSFILCWTPEAKGGGGTGQAIRIAQAYNVPVFDLADRAVCDRVREGLGLR